MSKIYPNDPCPCGSGEKYKKCCGAEKKIKIEDLKRSDLHLNDFVLENLSADMTFLSDALQLILGPYGYNYCEEHALELELEYRKDHLQSYVKADKAQIYSGTVNSDKKRIMKVRPYGGQNPEEQNDIMSLFKKGYISFKGLQVELFHAYLMDYLIKRFDDYLYVPTDEAMQGETYGSFAHRGYDFLLAITLYLELQLGVHVYLNIKNIQKYPDEDIKVIKDFFFISGLPNTDEICKTGLMLMLTGYMDVIDRIYHKYSASNEVEIYHAIGAYDEKMYQERKKFIQPGFYKPHMLEYNYISYLRFLVSATCFNEPGLYDFARRAFPQCDFIKYVCGIEHVIDLFENKSEDRIIDPTEMFNLEALKEFEENTGIKINREKHLYKRKDLYDNAVFDLMDELNGMFHHFRPNELQYIDFADINEDEHTTRDEKRKINPARKSTRVKIIRKLRMEIYNILNGKSFTLLQGSKPGDFSGEIMVAKYPILPWVSSGLESTTHCKPFDWKARPQEDLNSMDVIKRQEYLTMEYRLTSIPVNCIEEYLNPEYFYTWEEKRNLLKITEQQNKELKEANERLKRHIELNRELVRNLSHSSANYLNSNKLARTGIELHQAQKDSPTIEQLRLEGLSLILQSEQEMFLSRQLNSLVWRCSADVNTLSEQIRAGLSREEGESILAPFEFALKIVMARVLFREDDRRGEFIREKMKKTDEEITQIKSSFILDVLTGNYEENGKIIEWWNKNIGELALVKSPVWEKLLIKKDKSFYDLIIEVLTEQLLNALSHGDIEQGICIELGQAEEYKGRPKWVYILCENACGERYAGGRGVGIFTLGETMLLLNSNERGIETEEADCKFRSKVWIKANLLKAL